MTLTPAGRRRAVVSITAPVALLAGLAAAAPLASSRLIINETASVPRGLYLRLTWAAPRVGQMVALRPPSAARAYLRDLGAPPDFPLLKRIIAAEGDIVCRHGALVTGGGRQVRAEMRDRRGAALPAWRGCHRLAAGEYLVLGDSAASFDSRYFGAVVEEDLRGVYRGVWPW